MRKFLNIAVFVLACLPVQAQVQMLFSSDSLFNITSPLAIDSLYYWFDASQGVTDSLGGAIANNEGVGQWNDLSGHGYHVTQTTDTDRPVYKATGGPGSKPGIQWDGTDDFLKSSNHFWGSDDISIIVVYKHYGTKNAAETILSRYTTPSDRQFYMTFVDAVTDYLEYGFSSSGSAYSGSRLYSNAASYNTAFVLTSATASNPSTLEIFRDGSGVTETDGGTPPATIYNSANNGLTIGAIFGGTSNFAEIVVSEIIVYSAALSAAQRGALETYLNKKYDLHYFLILAFPVAGIKRRKLKEAA